MNAPQILQSTTVFFGLRCILQACPSCGNAVPINGLVQSVQCPSCLARVELGPALWNKILQLPVEPLLETRQIESKTLAVSDDAGRLTVSVERVAMPSPACVHCGAPLPYPREALAQGAFRITCAGCGKPADFVPPGWQQDEGHQAIAHSVGAETDGPGVPAGAIGAAQGSGRAPVVMTCPRCTAALEIDEQSKRTVPCVYCGAAVYLPEDLWRQLHPVKTSLLWTVVVRLLPEVLVREEAEVYRSYLVGMMVMYGVLLLLPVGLLIAGVATGDVGALATAGVWFSIQSVIFGSILGYTYRRSRARRAVAERLGAGIAAP